MLFPWPQSSELSSNLSSLRNKAFCLDRWKVSHPQLSCLTKKQAWKFLRTVTMENAHPRAAENQHSVWDKSKEMVTGPNSQAWKYLD